MKKEVILFAICCLFIACNKNDPYQGHYIDLSFEEELTVGQPDSLSESMLYFSRDVRVGPDGKIYAADAANTKIKVYSNTGKFLHCFGRRGRGPGEFTDIRGFAVTDSTVLVWDQSIQRMTVFGLDGKLHRTHNFEGLPSPLRIYPLKNAFLVLHIDENYGKQIRKTRLGHTYSVDFSEQKANFLQLKDIDEQIEEMPRFLLSRFGHILTRSNQQFLFVPILYNGNIYEYTKTSAGWRQTRVYEGLNQQTPYSLAENGGGRKPDGSISSVSFSEDKPFIVHNLSRGLFGYNGYIFHFTFSDVSDKRVFGVEVYDENLNPVGYAPIKSIPITNKEDNFLSWFVEDVDKKGNFYFLQRNDRGTKIRVMRINDEDLKALSD